MNQLIKEIQTLKQEKNAVILAHYYVDDSIQEIADYIDANENLAEITADFHIFSETVIYEAGYRISLQRSEKGAEILRETLSCAVNNGNARSNKTVFIDYQRSDRRNVFTPRKRLDEVVEADGESKTDLIVARKMAEKSNCSYIFGESSREIFCRKYDNNFRHCSEVIKALFQFALKDLFVIRNTHSGVISANFLLPMAFPHCLFQIFQSVDCPVHLIFNGIQFFPHAGYLRDFIKRPLPFTLCRINKFPCPLTDFRFHFFYLLFKEIALFLQNICRFFQAVLYMP